MQNPWVTLGLVALVIVLLIVLWLRRPRHDRHLRAAPSIEEQVAGFVARDAELLGVLRRRGVDLNAPRHIDLHFLADTKETADALMRSLGAAYPDGKREVAGPLTAQGTTYWSVTCIVRAAISTIVERDAVETRVRLATAAGAVHDGWGTPLE